MSRLRVVGLVLLGLAASGQDRAAESPMAQALKTQDWRRATAIAAGIADPLASQLVTWLRLLRVGGQAGEVEAFIARHPNWPNQPGLRRRLGEALAAAANGAVCPGQCLPGLPYADAASDVAAILALRRFWTDDVQSAADEQAFLRAWSGALDPAASARRFERLVWQDGAAALRQATRLGPDAAAARAWAALRQNAPSAMLRLSAADRSPTIAPFLQLERLAWERRQGQLDATMAGWRLVDPAVERQHPDAFWTERDRLARTLLAAGRNAEALQVVAAAVPPRAAQSELAGWILLRRLGRPAEAGSWFDRLAALSHGSIGIAEAQYWRGRTAAAMGDSARATAAWQAAASWPTTFAGQAAARALGENEATLLRRIAALPDPAASPAAALALASAEFSRAAEWLVAWGEPNAARSFLRRLDSMASEPAEQALAASLALRLGLPDVAVEAARRAGQRGLVLAGIGWPRPYAVPASSRDAALVLGIARQESSFNPAAVSPAGARGLMQLMQPTAAELARRAGLPFSTAALTDDPSLNLALGSLYLDQLLGRFGQPALAAAAYNAGPHRVAGWLAGGSPGDETQLIDWLMTIPLAETRTYVQRVLENRFVYEARAGRPVR